MYEGHGMSMLSRAVCILLVIPPLVIASMGAQQRNTSQDTGASLPEGVGKKLVVEACLECHSSERTTSIYRSPEQWKEIVTRMIAGGASLNEKDGAIVADYLAKNYGPANAQAMLKKS